SSNGLSTFQPLRASLSPLALVAECVCVADIIICAAGMPVSFSRLRLASSKTSRLMLRLSTTTHTSRVSPLSKTNCLLCSSSCIWLAIGSPNPPTKTPPKAGVILVFEAPASKGWGGADCAIDKGQGISSEHNPHNIHRFRMIEVFVALTSQVKM